MHFKNVGQGRAGELVTQLYFEDDPRAIGVASQLRIPLDEVMDGTGMLFSILGF